MATSFFVKGQTTSFFVEQQNYFNKKSVSPSAFIWADKSYKDNGGVFVFALANQNWGEILIGPKYTIKSKKNQNRFLEIGAGLGIETDKKPLRGTAYYFFNTSPTKERKGTIQSLGFVEYGGSGYWYLWFGTYNISNSVAIGIHAQSFNGVLGPRLQFQKGSFMAYVVGGKNLELKECGGVAGLRYYF
ncbi:MAG TPA: hypothetical protein PLQ20_01735 [Candidatus Paceibacterota bacterium]|nr:hypothetical protein [Candidatus Paceibacterota bacterium]